MQEDCICCIHHKKCWHKRILQTCTYKYNAPSSCNMLCLFVVTFVIPSILSLNQSFHSLTFCTVSGIWPTSFHGKPCKCVTWKMKLRMERHVLRCLQAMFLMSLAMGVSPEIFPQCSLSFCSGHATEFNPFFISQWFIATVHCWDNCDECMSCLSRSQTESSIMSWNKITWWDERDCRHSNPRVVNY